MAGTRVDQQVPADFKAREAVWIGSIPLRIELEPKEVTTLNPPPPLFLMAPRLGYLPLLAGKIEPHFRSALPPGTDTIWFEFQGLPLKWHIPTGVLFDLLVEDKVLPWRLTVHFRTYPSDLLIPIEGQDTLKWSYMNALKEAVYIMHGNTKPVMGLSQRDQEELWRSVSEGDWSAHEKVAASFGTGSRAKSIPLRLYLRQSTWRVGKWDEVVATTRCADTASSEGGASISLGAALHKALPQLFMDKPLPVPAMALDRRLSNLDIEPASSRRSSMGVESTDSPRRDSSDGAESSPKEGASRSRSELESGERVEEATGFSQSSGNEGRGDQLGLEGGDAGSKEEVVQRFKRGLVVRIQGTEPSQDVPLDWLSRNLSHPDHFLHICILRQEAQGS